MKKYNLLDEVVQLNNVTLRRIEAASTFTNEATGEVINKGCKGGFVQSEHNLSQDGTCWVATNARVFGKARVTGDAMIEGSAHVYGRAFVAGKAHITDSAEVGGSARITGNGRLDGRRLVEGIECISGDES